VFGDMLAGTFWVVLGMSLYLLLRHVHQLVAGAMVALAAAGGGIQVLNQLNLWLPPTW
jgi:hypothetical protein